MSQLVSQKQLQVDQENLNNQEKLVSLEYKDFPQISFGDDVDIKQKKSQINNEENESKIEDQIQKMVQNDVLQLDQTNQNQHSEHNIMIFNNYQSTEQQQIENIFYDYAQQKEYFQPKENNISVVNQSKQNLFIKIKDLHQVLKKQFENNDIQIFKSQLDQHNIFQNSNYQQEIDDIIKQFIIFKNIQLKPDEILLYLQDYVEFLNFLIKNIPGIYLKKSSAQQETENKSNSSQKQFTIDDNQKQGGLLKQLQQSIDRYQSIYDQASDKNEKQIIMGTITALKQQINFLNKENQKRDSQNDIKMTTGMSNVSSITKVSKDNIRNRNLKFIFIHYAKQQYFAGVKHTFERIQEEKNLLNPPKLALFLNDFKIANHNSHLQKRNIPSIFKQATNNQKNMNFQEFKIFLEKVGLLMFEGKETELDKIECLYRHIHLDDLLQIKKLCQSQSNINPFNIKDKDGFRLLPQDIGREIKLKKMDQEILEHIKQKKIKDKQKQLENMKLEDGNKSFFNQYKKNSNFQNPLNISQNQSFLNNTNNKSFINSSQSQFGKSKFKYTYDNYSQRKVANQEQKSKQKQVFSWAELEKSSFKNINLNQMGNFKPEDLIEETDDDEDEIYLKQYQLERSNNDEGSKNGQQLQKQKINLDDYGIIHEKIRPTQQYLMQHDPNYDPNQKYQNKNHQRQNHSVENLSNQFSYEGYGLQNQLANKQKQRNLTGYSQQYSSQNQCNQELQGLNRKQNSISQQYLKRAHQIEGQFQNKQQEQISRLNDLQQMKSSRVSQNLMRGTPKNNYSYISQNTQFKPNQYNNKKF